MNKIERLTNLLQTIPDLELAALVGSRARETATQQSDWDIAIRWKKHINGLACLERSEILKQQIADTMGIPKDQIDLIDLAAARLAMRAVIAEEGIMLKGEETLAWSHYLTQTWGEMEDYYWRQNNELDLYQAGSERIANEQMALPREAKQRILSGAPLSRLEQSGVLHALQVLIENAIGKSKHLLKSTGEPVPVSAYDAFASLERHGEINSQELQQWNSSIGLRNWIVHDYMNIDMRIVYEFITNERHQFIAAFLRKPILTTPQSDAKN